MSASACLVFYGLRYEVPRNSWEALLENQADPRIQAAKSSGLHVYWANFGGLDERYLLFIGSKVGMLGPEDAIELEFSMEELQTIATRTSERLVTAGLVGSPALYFQWEEDV